MSLDYFSLQSKRQNHQFDFEKIRILLWDIDGTLIHSNQFGAYKDYFIPTLEQVYGTSGKLAEMQVSGMTDTQIAFEALQNEGFDVADIFAKVE